VLEDIDVDWSGQEGEPVQIKGGRIYINGKGEFRWNADSPTGAERSRRRLDGLTEWNLSCAELIARTPPQEDSIHIAGI